MPICGLKNRTLFNSRITDKHCGFLNEFGHWQQQYSRERPQNKTFIAALSAVGCGIDTSKIQHISRGINPTELETCDKGDVPLPVQTSEPFQTDISKSTLSSQFSERAKRKRKSYIPQKITRKCNGNSLTSVNIAYKCKKTAA